MAELADRRRIRCHVQVNVGRLNVAMSHAERVDGIDGLCNFAANTKNVIDGHRARGLAEEALQVPVVLADNDCARLVGVANQAHNVGVERQRPQDRHLKVEQLIVLLRRELGAVKVVNDKDRAAAGALLEAVVNNGRVVHDSGRRGLSNHQYTEIIIAQKRTSTRSPG